MCTVSFLLNPRFPSTPFILTLIVHISINSSERKSRDEFCVSMCVFFNSGWFNVRQFAGL